MSFEDDEIKSKVKLVPSFESGKQKYAVPVEQIKSTFIVEGLTVKELAERFYLAEAQIQKIVDDNKLEELRAAHIKHGLSKLQNIQVHQAEKLMDLEMKFKRMRLLQLEKMLQDYMAYYSLYGHFCKVHPVTKEVLKDTNGIPIQLNIPNVTKEIMSLKESVSLSEGLKNLLGQIDSIINKPKDVEKIDPNTIDMESFGNIFQSKKSEDDGD